MREHEIRAITMIASFFYTRFFSTLEKSAFYFTISIIAVGKYKTFFWEIPLELSICPTVI